MKSQDLGSVSGEAIDTEARRRLEQSPYREIHSVQCCWKGGVLVLHGELSSFYLKQMAQACVLSLRRVEQIDNQIAVCSPGESSPTSGET